MSHPSVLFVVYDFPPAGARGTKRSVKFVQHLPKYGWAPVVLTVRDQPFDFYDGSMLAEIPAGVPVYRARTLEGLVHRSDYKAEEVRDPVADAKKTPPSFLHRAVLRVYRGMGRFVGVPDSRVLWLPNAVLTGLKLIRRHRCRLIYSSGPSHTNHVVAAILSRFFSLPLVIDFRDAWLGDPAGNHSRGKLETALERFCVSSATVVVSTTEGMRADFLARYSGNPAKYVTITNGFDPADFDLSQAAPPKVHPGTMKLIHVGTLGGERSPKEFLKALGQLLSEDPALKQRLEVVFVGKNAHFRDGRTIEEYVKEYGCAEVVKLAGYVSRKASLEYIQQAHALLLIIGRVPKQGAYIYGISGKIYDYAAGRRPVLTIAEPGSSAEMAARLKLGPVVHPDDTDQIKKALLSFVHLQSAGTLRCELDEDLLKSFEFPSLTARLAGCFDRALLSGSGKEQPITASPVRVIGREHDSISS